MAGIIEVKDQGKVRIYDADNSNYVDIVVPSTVSSNRTITIPDASFTIPTTNTIYTHPNHSGEVTSSADGATVIADNVVDEANLKVSNSPTNGYMLTAQSGNTGGLTWAEAGGGSWVKISTTTASNSSRISFDNLASTYQMYAIKGSQIRPDTNGVTFNMNFGSGGGTYAANKTSLYWMQYNNAADSDPQAEKSSSYSLGAATGDQVIGYGLSNNSITGKAGTLQVILGGLGQNSDYGSFTANYNYYNSNTYVYATNVTGQIVTTADSVTFVMSSGNIATGKFTLYGIDQ